MRICVCVTNHLAFPNDMASVNVSVDKQVDCNWLRPLTSDDCSNGP